MMAHSPFRLLPAATSLQRPVRGSGLASLPRPPPTPPTLRRDTLEEVEDMEHRVFCRSIFRGHSWHNTVKHHITHTSSAWQVMLLHTPLSMWG